jgi:hypothetical protein
MCEKSVRPDGIFDFAIKNQGRMEEGSHHSHAQINQVTCCPVRAAHSRLGKAVTTRTPQTGRLTEAVTIH